MNLYLAPLGAEQFAAASLQMVQCFAELLQPTRDLTMEEAVAEASAQFNTMLPRGLETPCQNFRQIMLMPQSAVLNIPQPIGFAWVHINPKNNYGVLCWFEIYKKWRGQKLARPAFTLIEQWLREEMKVPVLNLEVFAHNLPALALYDQCGFRKIGHVMQKKLL
jgi:GNAT superfamily N-acetyltransferase